MQIFLFFALASTVILTCLIVWMAWRNAQAIKKARRELMVAKQDHRLHRQQLRLLFANVQELVFRTDPDGNIVFANSRWQDITGRSPDSASGLSLQEAVVPADRDGIAGLFTTLNNKGVRTMRVSLKNAGGQLRTLDVSIFPLLGNDGLVTGYAGSAADVTDLLAIQRQLKEQLTCIQKLEVARDLAEDTSRTKSEFVANISHELRTPLQSIIGFSELGITRGENHPKLAAMFKDIHEASQSMLRLVNDLLDIAKIESTVGAFRFDQVELRGIIEDVAHEMMGLFQKKQLKFKSQLTAHPLLAKVDPSRFQQVIRNIFANAIKFSPPNSSIDVTAEILNGSSIHIQVRDSGPGIPINELNTIFEPFVQSSATRNQSGGTGLGLAISRKIITSHGGLIYATNGKEGGAIFHVLLPTASYSDTIPATLT